MCNAIVQPNDGGALRITHVTTTHLLLIGAGQQERRVWQDQVYESTMMATSFFTPAISGCTRDQKRKTVSASAGRACGLCAIVAI